MLLDEYVTVHEAGCVAKTNSPCHVAYTALVRSAIRLVSSLPSFAWQRSLLVLVDCTTRVPWLDFYQQTLSHGDSGGEMVGKVGELRYWPNDLRLKRHHDFVSRVAVITLLWLFVCSLNCDKHHLHASDLNCASSEPAQICTDFGTLR